MRGDCTAMKLFKSGRGGPIEIGVPENFDTAEFSGGLRIGEVEQIVHGDLEGFERLVGRGGGIAQADVGIVGGGGVGAIAGLVARYLCVEGLFCLSAEGFAAGRAHPVTEKTTMKRTMARTTA